MRDNSKRLESAVMMTGEVAQDTILEVKWLSFQSAFSATIVHAPHWLQWLCHIERHHPPQLCTYQQRCNSVYPGSSTLDDALAKGASHPPR